MSTLRHCKNSFRLIAFNTIALTLWLGFASVQHQYDFIPSHHAHHQCEQFSAVHGAVTPTAPTLTPSYRCILQKEKRHAIDGSEPYYAYLARSPPFLTTLLT
ncbi:DUF2607 family protein [Vibrio paucivorans]